MATQDVQMLPVYRHDAHKMRGRSHAAGERELAGVTVNQDVPYGADGDAARLSRPSGKPQETIEGHETHYRRSLLTGNTKYDPDTFALRHYESELHQLLKTPDVEGMHGEWLTTDVVSAFNESTYYPYTSLKYHTLLVAALVANYREGTVFDELSLFVDSPRKTVPHKTVYSSGRFNLRIDKTDGHRGARLGSRPWQSWSSVWSRLPQHPIDTDKDRYDMVLDSQLRRIQSWSTALAYLDDFAEWRGER